MGGTGSGRVGMRAARIPGEKRQFYPGVITGPRPGLPAPKRDRRSKEVRRALNRMRVIADDLGGQSELSQVQIDLLERYAWACHWLEKIEDIVLRGGKVPPEQWFSLLAVQTRIASMLGLERKARRVPSLAEYLSAKSEAPPAADLDAAEDALP